MNKYDIKSEDISLFIFDLLDEADRDYLRTIAEDVMYTTEDATQERRVAYALIVALETIRDLLIDAGN